MDTTTKDSHAIRFGRGKEARNLGTASVDTKIGTIKFHIIDAPTPFLLCVKDMNDLHTYLKNTRSLLIYGENEEKSLRVVWKWGHPFFHLSSAEAETAFLTEIQLRRMHRRFGHPAVPRLHRLLREAGHADVTEHALLEIEKFCHSCQIHAQAPRRFKFTIQDEVHFNYEIFIDVMYLAGSPVLHVVDAATSFHGGKFLKSMSAKDTWEALRQCWIDTYVGPPDTISHDAGTNFASMEFRAEARIMGITCNQVAVEAHWAIGKVERYHTMARRVYEILTAEIGGSTSKEAMLQMTWKAINDTAGPNGLVPTLLVFGTYPRISEDSPPSPSMRDRAMAIQKAMKELRKLLATRKVNDAVNTRNGPDAGIPSYAIQSQVRVWREKVGWQGPFRVVATKDRRIVLELPNGPTEFSSLQVRSYYQPPPEPDPIPSSSAPEDLEAPVIPDIPDIAPSDHAIPGPQPEPRRLRGRPKGSKTKPKDAFITSASIADVFTSSAYLSEKEKSDMALCLKLRADGVIQTAGEPFEESDMAEIDSLTVAGALEFMRYDPVKHGRHRIYRSRLVREVKGKSTKPYEKSRLVVQGFNDQGKKTILTQSPTIQRSSQRLLLALAPSLIKKGHKLSLRDITQAYTQAKDKMHRTILIQLPKELKSRYPADTVIHVRLALYGVPEAGVYWFKTYHSHHCDNLFMITSSYDPCLLLTTGGADRFALVALQTDDTLILSTQLFSEEEEAALAAAKFRAKPKQLLTHAEPMEFNGCTLTLRKDGVLALTQKGQSERIALIDPTAVDAPQRYVEQRARGAYVASLCQPEAAYDLSVAAQNQEPTDADYTLLNARLDWQIRNMGRGLNYVPLDLATAKLIVFPDGSFANNKDLSSQLGYIAVLANEAKVGDAYEIYGNAVHWRSTKCKRVTRSVLASEIYGMVNGFDMGIAMLTTLRMVTSELGLPAIPLVLATDSYSLYECLVKLGTTDEKRLMIDLMALRQSYERREISTVRWINGLDNPADALTKGTPNKALERLISTNRLIVRVEGFVERPEDEA